MGQCLSMMALRMSNVLAAVALPRRTAAGAEGWLR
jgi:hypothetical protein